jgi:regulator of sigma E protease
MRAFKAGAMNGISPRFTAVIDSVIVAGNAEKAGLQKGDSIIAVNDHTTAYWDQFQTQIRANKSKDVSVIYSRDEVIDSLIVSVDSLGIIGVVPVGLSKDIVSHKDYSFGAAIPGGLKLGMNTLSDYVSQLKFLFTKEGASSIGGFGAFGSLFSPTWDWQVFWGMTAFISIMLAFMNFLPIPALDGGHIMFLLYEMITGRKPNEKLMEYAQMAGIILLLGLLLYANGNDIYKALFGK